MAKLKSVGTVPLLVLCVFMSVSPALSQSAASEFGQTLGVSPPSNDPADRLAANLVLLSQNPKNVNALIEAGKSAIAIGDGAAALSFLSRAVELAPNDGRAKAALGSALVMAERPAEAITLFADAGALGISDREFVSDRGLAYDLLGDSRRAQRDYQIALRNRVDDEVTRRLALSYGISGDRDLALRILDPLLRQQDPSGWRARAFVLAMNGDVRGAESIVGRSMPIDMAETMRPFLRRLASLGAADRAHAVNFGTMPSDTRFASASTGALIPAPELAAVAEDDSKKRKSQPVSKSPRRRPGRDDVEVAVAIVKSGSAPTAPGFSDIFAKSVLPPPVTVAANRPESKPAWLPAVAVAQLEKTIATPPAVMTVPVKAPEPEEIDQPNNAVFEVPAPVAPKPAVNADLALVKISPPVSEPARQITAVDPGQAAVIVGGPRVPTLAAAVTSAPVKLADAPPTLASAMSTPLSDKPPPEQPKPLIAPVPSSRGLAGLLADIEPEQESVAISLPSAVDIKLARIAAQRKIIDAAAKAKAEKDTVAKAEKAAADRKLAEATAAAKKSPARVWVQVATGANESGLGITWKRLREKAPDTFKGLSAAYVPFKATNRVLVGPFKSGAEARALVNTMNKAGLSANTYSSDAGQEIIKIAVK